MSKKDSDSHSKNDLFKQGTKYKIHSTEEGEQLNYEGTFVSEDKDFIYLKLGSGYNIGISKEKIVSAVPEKTEHRENNMEHSIENKKHSHENKGDETKDKEKDSEILILHTGGTIASKVDYSTGAVNAKFTPEEMLELFPELKNIAKIDSKLIRNMWSDDMRVEHYNILAEEINSALNNKSLKGVILTHGTDTLHYTSSALSFIFENLPIPVVLVGSQRSSDRPSSDAALNLLSAALFISKAHEHNIKGVFLCMHESNNDDNCIILPPQNVRKMHSSRRDAFKCVNCSPLARINFERKEIEFLQSKNHDTMHSATQSTMHSTETSKNRKEISMKLFDSKVKVGIIRSRPSLYPEELKVYESFDGLILEGTGLGHFPIEQIDDETAPNKEIFEEIKKLATKKVVCMTTQTIFGRVNMNVYSPGRMMKDAGVLGHNLDMTTETAYLKLLWLLGNYSKDEVKKLYSENLRGEISKRIEKEEFL